MLAVGKSKDLFVQGHQIQLDQTMLPAANRSTFARVFDEVELTKPFAEICVCRIWCDSRL